MKAVVFGAPGIVEVAEKPDPEPGPDELLIAPLAVGLCHSDVHLRRHGSDRVRPGTVVGHEICGRIEAVGAAVTGWSPGTTVVVYPIWSCGRCRMCLCGRRNACLAGDRLGSPRTPGVTADGGLAELMVVPASAVLPADGLDPLQACTYTDAVLVPYGSIADVRADLVPGATAVVIGIGGLGLMALQILRATTGATVIAADVKASALQYASQFAAATVDLRIADARQRILDVTGPAGATVVFDFVGIDATLELACDVVAPFGAVQVTGMGAGRVQLTAGAAGRIPRGVRIAPRLYNGTFTDLADVLALGRTGAIAPVLQQFDLDDTVAALDALEAGAVDGRAVIRMPAGASPAGR
jgi:alcohol dehydrogenase, propanol-preferring